MKKTGRFVFILLFLVLSCIQAEGADWKEIVEKNRVENNQVNAPYVSNLSALNITYEQFFAGFNNLVQKEKRPYKIKMEKLSVNGHNEAEITKAMYLSFRTNTQTKRIEYIGITSEVKSDKNLNQTIDCMSLVMGAIDPKLSRHDREVISDRLALDHNIGRIRPTRSETINDIKYNFHHATSGATVSCWFNATPSSE